MNHLFWCTPTTQETSNWCGKAHVIRVPITAKIIGAEECAAEKPWAVDAQGGPKGGLWVHMGLYEFILIQYTGNDHKADHNCYG